MIDLSAIGLVGLWIAGAAAVLAWAGDRWTSGAAVAPIAPAHPALRLMAAWEPALLFAIAPALLFPTRARLAVLVIVPLLVIAQKRVTGQVVPATPFNASVWLLLAMTGVSLWATFDLHNSLGKVSGLVLDVLIFWAIVRWTSTRERLSLAITLFLVAGAGLAVIGLLGTNWFGKFGALAPILDRLPRAIRGVPGAEEGFQPNAVAGCLVLFIPAQCLLLAERWRATRQGQPAVRDSRPVSAEVAMLALTAGTLLLTQSRGAWSGLVIATVAVLLWHRAWTRWLGAGLIAIALIVTVSVGPQRVATMALSRSGPAMTQNIAGRSELWARAVQGIADFPLSGMGMNAFRRLMPTMYPTLLATPDVDVAHAHNHLLQAALDLGLPGLIAYLALWMTAARILWRVYHRAPAGAVRAMAGGLAAGLLAHFVFGLADVIPLGSKVGLLFWLTLALAAALDRVTASADVRA